MRVLQGLGGGPVIPMAQAIMWEIFPLAERGTAMAVWGVGIMLAPILGPTLGGWICDNWSWRWIFYINLPIGIIGFFMISAFLFDAPFHRRPRHVDLAGIGLMVIGFGCLQLVLDLGERNDWFDSTMIVMLAVVAVVMLIGFMARELMASEPILDLRVFAERNFGLGTVAIFLVGLAFNSSILMVALYTQKILGYDAWTAGLTLAPGGLGTMIALMISGRLVSRMDQRIMLVGGCLLQAVALWLMTEVTSTMDFEALAWPRFVQGFSAGFIFVPLQALSLANIPMERLGNATSAYNLVRNIGGSVGVALMTTLLARRAQEHQAMVGSHVNLGSHEVALRLHQWTAHFLERGADPEPTVTEIEALGGQALGVECDVSREADTQRLATETLARFGRIDVLGNNAALYGTLKRRPFMEIPVEEWDRVMAVNLRGLFLCARAVFPAMRAQGKGKIVNIASSTFFKGVPDYIHYTTSKGGVVGFTRSLARELGPFGIRVNAIAPGFTLSGENEKNISEERKRANVEARMLKRAQMPEDLVGTLVFLASDDSDFMSGQTMLVDGGGSVH